jgi:hypothetical protein
MSSRSRFYMLRAGFVLRRTMGRLREKTGLSWLVWAFLIAVSLATSTLFFFGIPPKF